MIVAHLGPPLGRTGGPGGYLAQLRAALEAFGSGGHDVRLPAPAPQSPRSTLRPSVRARALQGLRRLRRTVAQPPDYYRPSMSELVRMGGELDGMIARAWRDVQHEIAPSLEQAIGADAAVIVAHDAPSAEAALERRGPHQQVWLLMHSPMPLGLYLGWCWGVPDRPWTEVAAFPDVQRWMTKELRIIERVDRVLIPCREAVEELVRIAARFGPALSGAEELMTGASGPPVSSSAVAGRRRWGLPANRPVGLYLGNAQPYRGLDTLLAGLDRLQADGGPPGVVAVAGCPPDQLPLRRRLRALGSVSDVGDLLASVDFVINVNRFSLFDLSTIEALEAGRPLLMHETGGNRRFAALGAGAVMLPSLDPGAIARGLAEMFAMTPEVRGRLGAASRACYADHLSLAHLRNRHVALYDGAGAAAGAAR
ncbi:MAG: glycosyltransferase family 4 protein [Vicinamibacterales bacterium]|nr:glycosyltransferase family 4 protein [Vicinamibacterales bacterium]